MLIWVGIIFFSVLIHEYGHALTAIAFKQKAQIQLVALGGLTSYDGGPNLKFWQQFIVVLNGPLFGFGLSLLATMLLRFDFSSSPLLFGILKATQRANLFWSLINLLPVLPLDGGQLLRIICEGLFGLKGFRASLLIGAFLASFIACLSFLGGFFLAGAFFFLFAYQSFDSWRKCRFATTGDRDDGNKNLLIRAEEALSAGQNGEARRLLDEVRTKSSGGLLWFAASQYLAFLDMKEGKKEEAYQLLLSIKEHLAEESVCLLHELAAENGNDPLVVELSTRCYQISPTQEAALRNARSFARLGKAQPAGGWLQTAWKHGEFNIDKIVNESAFSGIKEDSSFKEFIDPLK